MEPRHDEEALGLPSLRRAVEDRESNRGLASRIDGAVELGLQLDVKLRGGADPSAPDGQRGKRGARPRR